jgi:biopolymer transport protein ExbD
MARTFRRQRSAQPIAELNVTNLIDLGFTLLIIFMIATASINQEQTVPVNLPVDAQRPQAKPDPATRFETITVRADGTYFLGTRTLTMAQLSAELAKFEQEKPKPPVFRIRADATATMQQWLPLISELQAHNLNRVTFDAQVTPKR